MWLDCPAQQIYYLPSWWLDVQILIDMLSQTLNSYKIEEWSIDWAWKTCHSRYALRMVDISETLICQSHQNSLKHIFKYIQNRFSCSQLC